MYQFHPLDQEEDIRLFLLRLADSNWVQKLIDRFNEPIVDEDGNPVVEEESEEK